MKLHENVSFIAQSGIFIVMAQTEHFSAIYLLSFKVMTALFRSNTYSDVLPVTCISGGRPEARQILSHC